MKLLTSWITSKWHQYYKQISVLLPFSPVLTRYTHSQCELYFWLEGFRNSTTHSMSEKTGLNRHLRDNVSYFYGAVGRRRFMVCMNWHLGCHWNVNTTHPRWCFFSTCHCRRFDWWLIDLLIDLSLYYCRCSLSDYHCRCFLSEFPTHPPPFESGSGLLIVGLHDELMRLWVSEGVSGLVFEKVRCHYQLVYWVSEHHPVRCFLLDTGLGLLFVGLRGWMMGLWISEGVHEMIFGKVRGYCQFVYWFKNTTHPPPSRASARPSQGQG